MTGTVLLVDDDPRITELVTLELARAGFETLVAASGAEATERFAADEPDVIVLDLNLPDVSGLELLEQFRRLGEIPIVMLTSQGAVETVVECMRLGAVDYVQKPFDGTRLITSVQNAAKHGSMATRLRTLTSELRGGQALERLIGDSTAMKKAVKLLRRAADSDVTVLVQGESGTGKEVAARALHAESARRSGPFVAVNCGAIPEGLIESELFGHEKGAFTGATDRHHGRFEQAGGGTIFLDEIGELRMDLQVKLLRVLQEHAIQRVGGTAPKKIDVRVLAATHRDLKAGVADGTFREDLYYRLAVFPAVLPPLRDRVGDVKLLAAHFLSTFNGRHSRKIDGFTGKSEQALEVYEWPGNVRELENVVERAVILEEGETISLGSLPDEVVAGLDPDFATAHDGDGDSWFPSPTPLPSDRRARTVDDIRKLDDEERDLIHQALELTRWNIVETAKRLGIGRATLYRKIEKFGLRT